MVNKFTYLHYYVFISLEGGGQRPAIGEDGATGGENLPEIDRRRASSSGPWRRRGWQRGLALRRRLTRRSRRRGERSVRGLAAHRPIRRRTRVESGSAGGR